MPPEKNQNLGNTTKENSLPVLPKLEEVEPVAEVAEVAENDGQTENLAEPVANSPAPAEIEKRAEIVEPATESPIIETKESEQKQSQPTKPPEQKVEEIPQAENLPPAEIQEVESVSPEIPKVEQKQPIQTQEIPPQPEIKTVEKIIYKTDPNFVQKLLVKARAKIQERKRKKLDKIMSLFETKSQISNSDVQKLLRTARRSAARYLDILEKEQKITQIGNIGKGVRYTKKP